MKQPLGGSGSFSRLPRSSVPQCSTDLGLAVCSLSRGGGNRAAARRRMGDVAYLLLQQHETLPDKESLRERSASGHCILRSVRRELAILRPELRFHSISDFLEPFFFTLSNLFLDSWCETAAGTSSITGVTAKNSSSWVSIFCDRNYENRERKNYSGFSRTRRRWTT